jgi:potassium-transporting ATPase KdpC subunit
MLIKETVNALAACVVSFLLCAGAYPAATWGLGQLFFPEQAEGSLIYSRDRTVIGSELIAQPFTSDAYFHPRPSAAGANGYAADAASGSNLGTKNPALRQRITMDVVRRVQQHTGDATLKTLLDQLDAQQAELKTKNEIAEKSKADTDAIAKLEEQSAATQAQVVAAALKLGEDKENLVPPDLVTTSGGGLDPHISPESARYQAGRVAAARTLPVARVLALIDANTERSGAIIGAPPRVNVLKLNRVLDDEKPAPAPEPTSPAVEKAPSTATDPAPTGEVAALRTQIQGLAGQLEQLGKQIDASRDEKTAAGLKDLETRVAAVAESTAKAGALTEQVIRIDERVKSAGEALHKLRSELDETRATLKQRSVVRTDSGQQ